MEHACHPGIALRQRIGVFVSNLTYLARGMRSALYTGMTETAYIIVNGKRIIIKG